MLSARLLLFLLLGARLVQGQQVVDLEEGKPYAYQGLEYGYYITNESSREVKGEDFDRFEVSLTVTNSSGCLKLIPFRSGWTSSSGSASDEFLIAEFNCLNATGKRLTAKKGLVNARAWYTDVRVPDEAAKGKYRTINAQVGYAIRNGQTITNKIIVIVPRGERPRFNCRTVSLPEAQ